MSRGRSRLAVRAQRQLAGLVKHLGNHTRSMKSGRRNFPRNKGLTIEDVGVVFKPQKVLGGRRCSIRRNDSVSAYCIAGRCTGPSQRRIRGSGKPGGSQRTPCRNA